MKGLISRRRQGAMAGISFAQAAIALAKVAVVSVFSCSKSFPFCVLRPWRLCALAFLGHHTGLYMAMQRWLS